ncbi:MAG: RNA polymerase sigma factor [Prevotellaceae bacterium]|nr:RNA polymerase sigma factor [Prevotellaceae bacterium]
MKQVSFRNDVLPLKNALYRLALRITLNSAEAEDIVQDTLIKVWNKRESWAEIDSIEAFSMTICRNLALDRIDRRGSHNASIDEQGIDSQDSAATPLEQTQQRDSVALVRQIIDSLPVNQRMCIQLRDFEGKTYKEIAVALDMTDEQVKINIFRARQTIKQRFTQIDGYGL